MARPKVDAETMKKLEVSDEQNNDSLKASLVSAKESMPNAVVKDYEPQTKLSQNEKLDIDAIVLKPRNIIASRDRFNERFRKDWEFAKEYVRFICENRECPGDVIEVWTRPYGGLPAEYWVVPTNKPVIGPRHLAEQIRGRIYHKMVMHGDQQANQHRDQVTGAYQMYGAIAVQEKCPRLTAEPVHETRSVFMPAKVG